MQLGEFGVRTSYRTIGDENAGEAAKLVEDLGFGTFWLGGSPQLPALRPLLESTERIVVATGILNVWASDPERVAADFAELEDRFPGRVLLGIGVGHPEATSQYDRPLAAMRSFLDAIDAAATPVPRTRRCLAALGPKMLRVSAERSLGAHTYFVPSSTPERHAKRSERRRSSRPSWLACSTMTCSRPEREPGTTRRCTSDFATTRTTFGATASVSRTSPTVAQTS
jgi:probable F420-dependent oxidoreductase